MDNQGDQFDQWNEQKKKIQAKVKKTYAKNIILGLCGLQCLAWNLWKSASFTRPVLVLKMLSARLFLGIPLK